MIIKNDFTKGSVEKNIIKLALQMIVAQLINIIVIAFANLIGMGGAPLFSIERGRENNEKAEKIMGNSLTLLIIIGAIITILGFIVKRPMLYLFGASEVTFKYASSYISIYLIGTIFVMIGLGMNSYINAQGFAGIGMLSVVLGAGMNIVLDPIFIYVLGMGVSGAALATIISQFCSCVWILRFLTGKKTILRLKRECFKLETDLVKNIVSLGMASFVMSITNSVV